MQNIYAILAKYNLTIPEDKKAEFEEAIKANYKTVAEVEKVTTARDNYKNQLETAQNALKEFEGVDVKELQGKIETLKNDLTTAQSDYENKIADMEFNSKLDAAIAKSGAKNVKAAKALLDLENLRSSKNQDTDLQAALDKVKEENAFLFGSDEPFGNPVGPTGGGGNPDKKMSLEEAMKYKNEHPEVDVTTLI